jgi:hypothetical protein
MGDYYKFTTGYNVNLVGILSSMRILSTYKQFLRPRPAKKGEKSLKVTFSDLQETFNLKSGLRGKDDYTSFFLKNVFKILVSPHTKTFPGGWVHAAKISNSTKSIVGLLFSMGWVEKSPLKSKILDVLFNDTLYNDKGDIMPRLINKKDSKRNSTFIEYRTGVALLLPMIHPTSKFSLDEQISLDPLKIKSDTILSTYSQLPYSKLVDKLNHASALKQSCTVKGSKTKPIHYEMAKNELCHLSDKVTYTDATGYKYDQLSQIPEHVDNFLRKKLSFPKKRAREEEGVQLDEQPSKMDVDNLPAPKHKKFEETSVEKVADANVAPNTTGTGSASVTAGPVQPASSSGAPSIPSRGRGGKPKK